MLHFTYLELFTTLMHNRPVSAILRGAIALAAVFIMASWGAAQLPAAQPSPCAPGGVRPQDQVWIISNRGLGCDNPARLAGNLKFWIYTGGAWAPSDRQAFLAADNPAVTTSVWVHGNQIDSAMAGQVGWSVYQSLVRTAPERPIRFVIWSWPSERAEKGPVNDARAKAQRTNPTGYYLAWLLDQIDPAVPVSLVGYSFGARVVSGALHLLGGGQIDGQTLSPRVHPRPRAIRTVLIAAAIDSDWLLPGRCHGLALSQVEQMLLINNGCDNALRRYHLLYCRQSGAEALGYVGLVGGNLLGSNLSKIAQLDACCIVGKRHDWALYFRSSDLVARMQPYVFFEPTARSAVRKESPKGKRPARAA